MEAIGGACQGLKIVGDIYAYMNKEISVRSRNVVAKKLLKITIDFLSDDEKNVSWIRYLCR